MNCPLCQSDKGRLVYPRKNPNLIRCGDCDFVYLASKYSKEIYNQDYFTKNDTGVGRNFFDQWSSFYDAARFIPEIRMIKRFKDRGKVLDIGCATGVFLEMISKEGFEPYGIDISSFIIDYLKISYGFHVFSGQLNDVGFEEKVFDVVTMHHILEHLPDPAKFLNDEVRPILKDDGILVVEVPNFRSFESKINREEWEDLRPEEHLAQFTPQTLRLCLEKAGFKIKRIYTYNPYFYRPIWHFSELFSYLGLPKSKIRKIARRIKLFLKLCRLSHTADLRKEPIKGGGFLNELAMSLAKPLDFIHSLLKFNKHAEVYAQKR